MDWIYQFPFQLPLNLKDVDRVIKNFSVRFELFFDFVRDGINTLIGAIQVLLNVIPWWLLLIFVFIGGWKMSGKMRIGILYCVMLFLVGVFGMWTLMNETLAIVLAAVFISVLLGFLLGILISGNERANNIVRPVLDTMQTMPVFVYLIPAVLFFGLGKAPAVIATTIYAIVPMVRLTNHGIRQVDAEVVEASKSFGSTDLQLLVKVLIPQALPTIMTGINQTLMMAMSMVVTCSMIGASGLGMEVLVGVNRIEIGRGLVAGSAIVIVAIVMDRFTQGWIKREEVSANVK